MLACAAGVYGTILVYNRNLQYMRKIQHNGVREFYDISADSQHNLYVADHSNDTIHSSVLMAFICMPSRTTREEETCIPMSVFHVYITILSLYSLQMALTCTHFGVVDHEMVGSMIVNLQLWMEMAVCIADCGNNRVQCF